MLKALVVVGLALVAAGCAMEKERAAKEQEFSAARLGGKFNENDPIVLMLAPGEREALRRAGMMHDADELAEGNSADGTAGATDDATGESTSDRVGGTMMSVLTVGVTLGMMAAPFLLF